MSRKCIDCGDERALGATKYCSACGDRHAIKNQARADLYHTLRVRGAKTCSLCNREESELVRFASIGNKCRDCMSAIHQEKQNKLCADCGLALPLKKGGRARCEECAEKHHKMQQKQWYERKKNGE